MWVKEKVLYYSQSQFFIVLKSINVIFEIHYITQKNRKNIFIFNFSNEVGNELVY